MPRPARILLTTSHTILRTLQRARTPYICLTCLHHHRQRRFVETATTSPPTPTSTSPTNSPSHPPTRPSLNIHTTLAPPTAAQLAHAARFFIPTYHRPAHRFLKSTPDFRNLPPSPLPEVAFLGRSNVGKSSVLNALLGVKGLAKTSSKKGRTKQLVAFGVGGVGVEPAVKGEGAGAGVGGRGKGGAKEGGKEREQQHERWVAEGGKGAFVVMDCPGYGKGSQARWGAEILKYLMGRKQLRRTFVLIDAKHGPKPKDLDVLALLQKNAIPHQLLLSKIDNILFTRPQHVKLSTLSKMKVGWLQDMMRKAAAVGQAKPGEGLSALGDVLGCSAEVVWPRDKGERLGISELRWAVLQAVGLDCGEDGRMRNVAYDLQTEPSEETRHIEPRAWNLQATG